MDKRIYKSYSTINRNRTKNGLIFNEDVVKQDIINVISTRKGEFPMDPERGCIIHNYLFEPSLNDLDRDIILQDVDKIVSADPRVIYKGSQLIESDQGQSLGLVINLTIRVIDTDIELILNFNEYT